MVWFRLGLWPAFLAALLPVLVALFHLAPAALGGDPAPHHQHAIHGEAGHSEAGHHEAGHRDTGAGPAAEPADEDGDRHPADRSEDRQPRQAGPHCPLCLWLKAFHALPPPDVVVLWLPNGRAQFSPARKPLFRPATVYGAAQPRAPPIALAV